MSRGLSSPQLTASAASHRVNVPLIEMLFDSGALRLAMAPWAIVVGADTYVATGAALKISAAKEDSTGLQGLTFGMSGLDAAIIAIATAEPYRGRLVYFRKGRLDTSTHALIGTPTIEWVGRMRDMRIVESNNTCEVSLAAEHYELELTRPSPRRWNDADQQRDFPGDKGCEYASQMTEKFLPFPAKEALRK
jgi:hypothetical protein